MATFPTSPVPQYEFIDEIEDNIAVTRYPNGTEQRIQSADMLRRFSLSFNALKTSEIDTLWNFYVARGGRLESFNYTSDRDSASYVVRFDMQSMTRTIFSYNLERAGIT